MAFLSWDCCQYASMAASVRTKLILSRLGLTETTTMHIPCTGFLRLTIDPYHTEHRRYDRIT